MDAKLEAPSPPCLAPAASVCIEQQQLIAQHLGAPTPNSIPVLLVPYLAPPTPDPLALLLDPHLPLSTPRASPPAAASTTRSGRPPPPLAVPSRTPPAGPRPHLRRAKLAASLPWPRVAPLLRAPPGLPGLCVAFLPFLWPPCRPDMDAKLKAPSPPCLAPAASVCIEQQQLID
nr:proline-rich protein 36-like [Aegilops tauschii subsp. strangulata]